MPQRHAYYLIAQAEQRERATLANIIGAVRLDLRHKAIDASEAIAELRDAGCFEAEIAEIIRIEERAVRRHCVAAAAALRPCTHTLIGG
jgi:hypothetical protein